MRIAGWEAELTCWATRTIGRPFVWGESDCAILCAEAFDVMTGQDHSRELRGAYFSRIGALRYQSRVRSLWSGLLGAGCKPLASPFLIARGDFLLGWERGFCCGHVCLGEWSLTAGPEDGVCVCDTDELRVLPHMRALRLA